MESGLRYGREIPVGRDVVDPADQDADAHADEDPVGERESAQDAPHERSLSAATSSPALASMPASSER